VKGEKTTKKIYIDPGHGGDNPGATYKDRKESVDVCNMALKVRELLEKQNGISVKLSRTADTDPALTARTTDANNWGADYFLSIHRNAFYPNKATGIEAWVISTADTDGKAVNKAKTLVDGLCAVTGLKNRGVKKGAPRYTDYAVNRYSKAYSCLLELGFVDNDTDNSRWDMCFDEMAQSIAKSISEIVGVKYVEQFAAGDVDGDGTVSVNDARTALRAAVKLETLSDEQKKRADTDNSGEIDVTDARAILRKAVGLDNRKGDNL
jgi:N-acetylmuramoyl-L-alanine amidase